MKKGTVAGEGGRYQPMLLGVAPCSHTWAPVDCKRRSGTGRPCTEYYVRTPVAPHTLSAALLRQETRLVTSARVLGPGSWVLGRVLL